MTTCLHEDRHGHYGSKRKIATTVYTTRKEGKYRVGKTPGGLFGIIRHSNAAIEPSDARNQDEHERKPEQGIKDNGRRHAETRVMQRLVCAARRLENRPASRKKRKPDDGASRPRVAAKREKEQRRNRQQGKVRRQAVLGYGLLHFSTSGAYRPCRGSGRNRSCARGHHRRRTCQSGTQAFHRSGGSG